MLGCRPLQPPRRIGLPSLLQQRRALGGGRHGWDQARPQRAPGTQQRPSHRASMRLEAEGGAGAATSPRSREGQTAAGDSSEPQDVPAAAAAAGAPAADAASGSAAAAAEAAAQAQSQPWISAAALRKVTAAGDANEAQDVLLAELGAGFSGGLSEAQCRDLIAACLERGNVGLAQSLFAGMTAAAAGTASLTSFDGGAAGRGAGFWPAATIDTATALVIGLAQALHTREAIGVINSVRRRGLPMAEDVHFGWVVDCPGAASGKPLTVVQPQEGVKTVVDSYTRYEYEVFSGSVTSVSSESLVTNESWAAAAARAVGLLRRPPTGATHSMEVQTPTGQQRTFRFSTTTADVPAKVGDRVSVVCSPQRSLMQQRRLFSASPPGTKPGEPLSLSNHTTNLSTLLLRPAAPGAAAGLPSWLLPVTAVLVASDAATSLISPAMPYIAAGAFAASVGAGVAANTVVLPRLKQLPERVVEVAATRQKLLKQHTALEGRVRELVDGAVEDVRMLARMWQLQNKMGAVGGEGAYDARLDRVVAARANLEQRLQKRVELVDAYARVINMIEIEVEMDTQVPVAEVLGIEEQIARLTEIEGLTEEWRVQAEAQDEVERLLRTQQA